MAHTNMMHRISKMLESNAKMSHKYQHKLIDFTYEQKRFNNLF